MNSKIITKFILGLIFIALMAWFIVFLFFSGNDKKIGTPLDLSMNIGKSIYIKNKDGILEKIKLDKKNGTGVTTEKGLIYREGINMYSEIYSSKNDYKLKETKNTIDIEIGKGKYLFNLKNYFKKIIIHGQIYDIISNKGGMFYIDNTTKHTKVLSFNVELEFNFIIRKTKNIVFKAYLFPHRYFKFNNIDFYNKMTDSVEKEKNNKKTLDFDVLRISQIGRIGYFIEDFNTIIEKNDITFIDKYGFEFSLFSNKEFLIDSIKLIKDNYDEKISKLKKIKGIKVGLVFGLDYIKEYFNLFFNEKKKVLYYKTIILDDIVRLFNEKKTITISNRLVKNISKLKELNSNEYIKINKIVNSYYSLGINDYTDSGTEIRNNFLRFKSIYTNKKNPKLFINSIYNDFNFSKKIIYSKLNKNFLKNIPLDKTEKEYYLWHFREIISMGFNNDALNKKDFNALLSLFYNFSNNLEDYNNFKIDKDLDTEKVNIIITKILTNEFLLTQLNAKIKKRYFKQNNEKEILTRTEKNIENITLLKEAFSKYINYFEKYKLYLSKDEKTKRKYSLKIEHYKKLNKDFLEYYLALSDYTAYLNAKKIGNFGGGKITDIRIKNLSELKLLKYMSQFKGVDFKSADVNIIGNQYYDISNIYIKDKWFSLKLYPKRRNRIDSIKYNTQADIKGNEMTKKEKIFYNQLHSKRFVLDDLKISYEKKRKKEKKNILIQNKYQFKNVFLNIFFQEKNNLVICGGKKPIGKGVIFTSGKYNSFNKNKVKWKYKDGIEVSEPCKWRCEDGFIKNEDGCEREVKDSVIEYFKSTILLGKEGEFAELFKFMPPEYKKIIVTKIKGDKSQYNILLKNAKIHFRIKKGKKLIKARTFMTAGYKLNKKDHYFYNIKLVPYKEDKKTKKITLTFGNNVFISLKGNSELNDLRYDIKKVLEDMGRITNEYNNYISTGKNVSRINYDFKTGEINYQ